VKIVIAVNPEQPCPPVGYGGTQRQAAAIAEGLVERGHLVTLLCGPGSTCRVDKYVVTTASVGAEWEYVSWLRQSRDWDVVLDMTMNHLPSRPSGLPDGSKTVAWMTGDPLRKYAHDDVRNRVYVSRPFAEFCGCPDHPAVSNVIGDDPATVPLGSGGGGYCCYLGTIRPEKGVHLAAEACCRLGVPFKVAGVVQGRFLPYWESFRGQVDMVGEVGSADRYTLLGGAAALVFPSLWCDAGPLAVKESLLCGTPVLACPNGGLTEDVVDGINGVLVEPKDVTPGLDRLLSKEWDRLAVRSSISERMNVDRYVDQVEIMLARVAKGGAW